MAKYSALKLAKDKIKQLEIKVQKLNHIINTTTEAHNKSMTAQRELFKLNQGLVDQLESVRSTFHNQSKTLKLAGDTIRELQRSRKRLKLIVRALVVTLVTIVTVGAFTL